MKTGICGFKSHQTNMSVAELAVAPEKSLQATHIVGEKTGMVEVWGYF